MGDMNYRISGVEPAEALQMILVRFMDYFPIK
eukprot:SAG31_NODE_1239_length_9169_cov_18.922492_18_plen_32_part_00